MIRHDPDNSPGERRRLRDTRMARVLPSLFTLGNALCGFGAIVYASRDQSTIIFEHWSVLTVAAALIFVGMVFDAVDGGVARITRQTSELGEQLDSMADMVTFGVAPAFLIIQLVGIGTPFFGDAQADTYFDRAVITVGAVYVACCALRLARFNIEIEQPEEADHLSFKGLPSPAAAGTVASLILLHESLLGGRPDAVEVFSLANVTAVGMVLIALLAAVAMVSTYRYVHVINRYLRGRAPFHYIAYGAIALPPLLIEPQLTLAMAFCAYALSSPAQWVYRGLRHPGGPRDRTEDKEGERGADKRETEARQYRE